jgi:hypothetical protein
MQGIMTNYMKMNESKKPEEVVNKMMFEKIEKPICVYCKKELNLNHWCRKLHMIKKFEEKVKK